MMTHAYREMYLSSAMALLGEAFDYAVNDCGFLGDDFVKIFSVSQICARIEKGDPTCINGKSGIEVVRECILDAMDKEISIEPIVKFSRTPEYWIGWAIAYYQWYSSRSFMEIFKAIPFETLMCMYPTLHEADVSKFADVMDGIMREAYPGTNLKRLRTYTGLSQKELSNLSGLSLRSIQMYEQRQKDINRASVAAVNSLAKVLGCEIEDLIEK